MRKFLLCAIAICLLVGMVEISYNHYISILVIQIILTMLFFLDKRYRLLCGVVLGFLTSFFLFYQVNEWLGQLISWQEVRILLNRALLVLIISALYFTLFLYKHPITFFHNRPQWDQRIYFPYMWSGFHSIKASTFLLIAITSNIVVFLPFILIQDTSYLKSVILFGILFALINGVLEEWLWRGILLSSLIKLCNIPFAVSVTSLGFGLQHLMLGFPLYVCLLFSLGGFFYAAIVLRTNSIYPAIIWHICINLGMVYSGLIL
ncbi:CPBP family intramembrane glutamic endopeptidase [Aquibacillus kalidii]|uniref:CPBP family intramembrane glutamic endopeptidase n=1 Tax=Aquibacillus kalidii TaxID=2762597 RepID=UPI00164511CD|nr:type II CAAX endopeptidase family protein [Aquibacillus kalidii]